MFRILFGYLIIALAGLCLASKADAETLILQNGQKVVGQIIERTELRIMVDVQGMPRTFFIGEIASIDGQPVSLPQDKEIAAAVDKEENKLSPQAPVNDEESSLINDVNNRKVMTHPPAPQGQAQGPAKLEDLMQSMNAMMGKMSGINKNVVSTPDGGIIVVGQDKIIKYDKNLNVIKEVPLNTDYPAGSK